MIKQFTLLSAKAAENHVLSLVFEDGEKLSVKVDPIIRRRPDFAVLSNQVVFRRPKLGNDRDRVVWPRSGIELMAGHLRAQAIEQAGGYSHEFIARWMGRHSLALDAAADALGISRRSLAYYRSGELLVPRTVGLACLGWELEQMRSAHAVTPNF